MDMDTLAAINFYLVKAQSVPVAGIDSVSRKQIRNQGAASGRLRAGWCAAPLARLQGSLFSPVLQNTWGALHSIEFCPSFPTPCLHFLLSSSGLEIVCSDCYQPPVSGLTVISCLCMSRRVTPSFLSKSLHDFQQGKLCPDFFSSRLGCICQCFFRKNKKPHKLS